jgi:hypothetical protein
VVRPRNQRMERRGRAASDRTVSSVVQAHQTRASSVPGHVIPSVNSVQIRSSRGGALMRIGPLGSRGVESKDFRKPGGGRRRSPRLEHLENRRVLSVLLVEWVGPGRVPEFRGSR